MSSRLSSASGVFVLVAMGCGLGPSPAPQSPSFDQIRAAVSQAPKVQLLESALAQAGCSSFSVDRARVLAWSRRSYGILTQQLDCPHGATTALAFFEQTGATYEVGASATHVILRDGVRIERMWMVDADLNLQRFDVPAGLLGQVRDALGMLRPTQSAADGEIGSSRGAQVEQFGPIEHANELQRSCRAALERVQGGSDCCSCVSDTTSCLDYANVAPQAEGLCQQYRRCEGESCAPDDALKWYCDHVLAEEDAAELPPLSQTERGLLRWGFDFFSDFFGFSARQEHEDSPPVPDPEPQSALEMLLEGNAAIMATAPDLGSMNGSLFVSRVDELNRLEAQFGAIGAPHVGRQYFCARGGGDSGLGAPRCEMPACQPGPPIAGHCVEGRVYCSELPPLDADGQPVCDGSGVIEPNGPLMDEAAFGEACCADDLELALFPEPTEPYEDGGPNFPTVHLNTPFSCEWVTELCTTTVVSNDTSNLGYVWSGGTEITTGDRTCAY